MADWYWTTNEESYSSGPHATRAAELEPGKSFWTAARADLTGKSFSVLPCGLLEQLGLDARAMVGEWAEEWPSCSDEHPSVVALGAAVSALVSAWVDEHDPPSFWVAGEVQEHRTQEVA